jgi:hypothetical protein
MGAFLFVLVFPCVKHIFELSEDMANSYLTICQTDATMTPYTKLVSQSALQKALHCINPTQGRNTIMMQQHAIINWHHPKYISSWSNTLRPRYYEVVRSEMDIGQAQHTFF